MKLPANFSLDIIKEAVSGVSSSVLLAFAN
jgi:hypothetical protein